MTYTADQWEEFKRAAFYVDKILKGARPTDLPVEQPKKFDFIVNLRAAKQIGLTIPPNVLARADRVIRSRLTSARRRSSSPVAVSSAPIENFSSNSRQRAGSPQHTPTVNLSNRVA